jgi:exodeoxyribonuclease VII large subunit
MKVIISGKLTVYGPRGNYQIECVSMKPIGQGDLYLAFEALKAKLEEDGYFDSIHKKTIPVLPMKIGVSTSPTGAAIKDIISTLERRFPVCEVFFRPTLVQGEGSAVDISKAIKELNQYPLDVIIIGRGGGSIEDLWAYNEEITAQAIFESEIPIISAVGHETDFTIADFVADKRAPTPTGAAEMITPNTISDIYEYLTKTKLNLASSIKRVVQTKIELLNSIKNSYAFRDFKNKIRNNQQWLDKNESDIKSYIIKAFNRYQDKVESIESHLKSLYPLSPLNKGFALLMSEKKYISENDSLGNYLTIDILRKNEVAGVTINNILPVNRKKKNGKTKK